MTSGQNGKQNAVYLQGIACIGKDTMAFLFDKDINKTTNFKEMFANQKQLVKAAISRCNNMKLLVLLACANRLCCLNVDGLKDHGHSDVKVNFSKILDSDITSVQCVQLEVERRVIHMFIVGTSTGSVNFVTDKGDLVHQIQLHESPIININAHGLNMGMRSDITAQGVTFILHEAIGYLSYADLLSIAKNGRKITNNTIRFFPTGLMNTISDAVAVGCTSSSLAHQLMGRKLERKARFLLGGFGPSFVCADVNMDINDSKSGLLSKAMEWAPLISKLKMMSTSEDKNLCTVSSSVPFIDPKRTVWSMTLAPGYPLLACADSLGRILIIDVANVVVIRVLKGYRDAQVSWIYASTSRKLYLLILAPKIGTVELWDIFQNHRIKHFDCNSFDLLCKCNCSMFQNPYSKMHLETLKDAYILSPSTLGVQIMKISTYES